MNEQLFYLNLVAGVWTSFPTREAAAAHGEETYVVLKSTSLAEALARRATHDEAERLLAESRA